MMAVEEAARSKLLNRHNPQFEERRKHRMNINIRIGGHIALNDLYETLAKIAEICDGLRKNRPDVVVNVELEIG
jgi:hypothetical protein